MRQPEDVIALYNQRVRDSGTEQQQGREITALYGGDVAVALPGLHPDEKPAVANVARGAIDQKGMRIASVTPEIAVFPSKDTRQSRNRARDRRRGMYGFRQISKTHILQRRRARHLVGYASAPVKIVPDFKTMSPRWKVRSPLATYASLSGEADDMNPSDCIFVHRQTFAWVKEHYPHRLREIMRTKESMDTAIDLIEYYDADVLYLIASRRSAVNGREWNPDTNAVHTAASFITLLAAPNRINRCPVIIPGAITLGPRRSEFTQLIGMYQAASELDALSRLAIRGAIKQEHWVISHPGESGRVIQAPDPANGLPGIIEDGSLETRTPDPQFATRIGVSDLERAQRVTAGIPADLGGESGSNIRTGRRGAQVLDAVMSFPTQEAHHLFEASAELENEIAVLTDLAYFREVPKVWQINYQGEKGDLAYVPGDLWRKNDAERTPAVTNHVSYSMAGLDAEEGIIALGQRLGMGTISKFEVMKKDPVVDDAEVTAAQVDGEALDAALLTQIQTLAANPESPLAASDIGKLKKLRKSGLELEEAWERVQEDIVKRANEAADPQNPATAGTVEAAPEVGPGIAPPSESTGNLNQLLFQLRGAQNATPQG